MFEFQNLEVYKKAKVFHQGAQQLIQSIHPSKTVKDQLHRASLSIVLNIAEGTSRYSKADKRNFYIISRGSAFECVAIFDVLKDEMILDPGAFNQFYSRADELSRMLFKMIGNLSVNPIN